ncbi:hypothetical protein ACFE04_003311 [Oxalis oulophora]
MVVDKAATIEKYEEVERKDLGSIRMIEDESSVQANKGKASQRRPPNYLLSRKHPDRRRGSGQKTGSFRRIQMQIQPDTRFYELRVNEGYAFRNIDLCHGYPKGPDNKPRDAFDPL